MQVCSTGVSAHDGSAVSVVKRSMYMANGRRRCLSSYSWSTLVTVVHMLFDRLSEGMGSISNDRTGVPQDELLIQQTEVITMSHKHSIKGSAASRYRVLLHKMDTCFSKDHLDMVLMV